MLKIGYQWIVVQDLIFLVAVQKEKAINIRKRSSGSTECIKEKKKAVSVHLRLLHVTCVARSILALFK